MRLTLTTILCFCLLTASAQSGNLEISGTVVQEDGSPVPYATVLAFKLKDSILVDGSSTGAEGNFSLQIPKGEYFIRVKFMGFTEQVLSPVEVSNSRTLDPIVLHPNNEILDAVDITVEKNAVELKLDKRVFNIQQDISSAGLNGAEILDNIPSISVDAEGNVSLRGSQNVRILINGKPSTLTGMSNADALRQINGNMIESVEVITNPSARYDAEGEVGIINIILKKDLEKGFNGSFNLRAGYPLGYGAGFNINYRTSKVNYFAGYGYGLQRSPGSGQNYQTFNGADTSYHYEQTSSHNRGGFSHNLNAGLDYSINSHFSVNLSTIFKFARGDNWNKIEYLDFDSSDVLTQRVNRNEYEDDYSNSQEYNLSFRKTFEQKDRLWTFDFKKIYSDDGEVSDLEQYSSDVSIPEVIQRTTSYESENSWLFQTDYIHPFGTDGKFETGAKVNLRTMENDYELLDSLSGGWQVNPLFNNYLIYTENIYAAYAMAGNKTGKFSYQGGLRSEYSDVTTNLVETNQLNRRQYFKLFPSFHFSYELKNTSFLQLSYSRRIGRPRQWWLTPFYTFRDSRNYESGNPDINPEYAGSYELSYLKYWKKGSLLGSVYYRHTSNIMERIVLTDSTGITWRIPVNLGTRNSFGAELSGSCQLNKWWNLSGNINFYRFILQGAYAGVSYNTDAYAWNGKITNRISLGKKFSLQTSFTYESPASTYQGSAKAQYYWDGGASIDLFHGNGTLTFNARDILNSRKRRSIVQSENFYSESYFQWRSRQLTLTFVYRINQKKGKSDRLDSGEGDQGM